MAKVYGQRWQLQDRSLGRGGQAEVFSVIDLKGQHQGEFALKRVYNAKRMQRFRNEIEAIKRLSHPNIIRLIDHSALDAPAEAEEKQFIVMPLALGGDLGTKERVGLYKDSLDGTLQVAKQLAAALAAAHSEKIIHRDVKPQNVLFTGNGHEVWLSDFGICLLREETRGTQDDEVVGPHAFMAPELEEGGQLDVSPSADVYSLGKTIYFMVSGGTVLPRERLLDEQYSRVFEKGERYRLLRSLLAKMICPPQSRIADMQSILSELQKIDDWEKNASVLPISAEAQATITRIQQSALEARRITEDNDATRALEERTLTAVAESFSAWLKDELDKTAIHLGTAEIKCDVRKAALAENNHSFALAMNQYVTYVAIGGFELTVENLASHFRETHVLQLFLCRGQTFKITVAHSPMRQSKPQLEPPRDLQLAFIPFYRQARPNQPHNAFAVMGTFTKKDRIGTSVIQPAMRAGQQIQITAQRSAISKTFDQLNSQYKEFKVSEWPSAAVVLKAALSEAIESFLTLIESGTSPPAA